MKSKIVLGDAKKLSKELPDESFDFVFCDPVYSDLESYEWLGKEAFRLLKPNKPCLVFGSQKLVRDYIEVLEKSGLEFVYTLSYVVVAKTYRLIGHNIFCWTTPCVWMNKGKFSIIDRIPDTFISKARPSSKHKWNKNEGVIAKWISAFTKRGDWVFDPFSGSGTVSTVCKKFGRNYIAFEKDEEIYKSSVARLSGTVEVLFHVPVENERMF